MTIEEMKQRKTELGYTNEKVSELSGVPLGTVHKVFAGETKAPRYDTIRKLESVLTVAESQTLGYDLPRGSGSVVGESSQMPGGVRLGLATGKYKVPEDIDFCNDEIEDLFDV